MTRIRPLTACSGGLRIQFEHEKDSITGGSVSSSDIDGVQSSLQSISGKASAKGQTIPDSVPGASQLSGIG